MSARIIQPLPPGIWLPSAGAYFAIDAQGRDHLVFPATTEATLYSPAFHVPPDITTPLAFWFTFRMASATSGNINVNVAVEAVAEADNFNTLGGSSFATNNASGSTAVPGTTAGRTKNVAVTLTNNDSIAAGMWYRLRLHRPSEANAMHILVASLVDDGA